jgi:hypothetical protein
MRKYPTGKIESQGNRGRSPGSKAQTHLLVSIRHDLAAESRLSCKSYSVGNLTENPIFTNSLIFA